MQCDNVMGMAVMQQLNGAKTLALSPVGSRRKRDGKRPSEGDSAVISLQTCWWFAKNEQTNYL